MAKRFSEALKEVDELKRAIIEARAAWSKSVALSQMLSVELDPESGKILFKAKHPKTGVATIIEMTPEEATQAVKFLNESGV